MPDQMPIHTFLLPRVAALVNEAVAQGMDRDAVVAVLIDIVTSPRFDTAAPDQQSALHPDWDRSHPVGVLVNDTTAANVPTVGVQAEDDFIAPLTFRD
jgi:hypothetical protein